MKLIHLSDLHLGKRLNEFSLVEDQEYILDQILLIIDRVMPDAVILAGDLYDKATPSGEAVMMLDRFLCALAARDLQVLAISGNHDSAERLSFGSSLMSARGVHLSPVYNGELQPLILQDEYGPVCFYLLPFLKASTVRQAFPEEDIPNAARAVEVAINKMSLPPETRKVLISHQFVTGAKTAGSEEILVGGEENVPAWLFAPFDYVALGHLHRAQEIKGRPGQIIRYCGAPLPYSFSEAGDEKSLSLVELGQKGDVRLQLYPLKPLRALRVLKGAYWELTLKSHYDRLNPEDYYAITLTDEEDVPEAFGRLRTIYPNLMKLDYDNARTRGGEALLQDEARPLKSPIELFSAFFEMQNKRPLSPGQREILLPLIQSVWEDPT